MNWLRLLFHSHIWEFMYSYRIDRRLWVENYDTFKCPVCGARKDVPTKRQVILPPKHEDPVIKSIREWKANS
jgi:hypothetical protein